MKHCYVDLHGWLEWSSRFQDVCCQGRIQGVPPYRRISVQLSLKVCAASAKIVFSCEIFQS